MNWVQQPQWTWFPSLTPSRLHLKCQGVVPLLGDRWYFPKLSCDDQRNVLRTSDVLHFIIREGCREAQRLFRASSVAPLSSKYLRRTPLGYCETLLLNRSQNWSCLLYPSSHEGRPLWEWAMASSLFYKGCEFLFFLRTQTFSDTIMNWCLNVSLEDVTIICKVAFGSMVATVHIDCLVMRAPSFLGVVGVANWFLPISLSTTETSLVKEVNASNMSLPGRCLWSSQRF